MAQEDQARMRQRAPRLILTPAPGATAIRLVPARRAQRARSPPGGRSRSPARRAPQGMQTNIDNSTGMLCYIRFVLSLRICFILVCLGLVVGVSECVPQDSPLVEEIGCHPSWWRHSRGDRQWRDPCRWPDPWGDRERYRNWWRDPRSRWTGSSRELAPAAGGVAAKASQASLFCGRDRHLHRD